MFTLVSFAYFKITSEEGTACFSIFVFINDLKKNVEYFISSSNTGHTIFHNSLYYFIVITDFLTVFLINKLKIKMWFFKTFKAETKKSLRSLIS